MKLFALALLGVVLSGCATTMPSKLELAPSFNRDFFADKTIQVTERPMPGFRAVTPGKAMLLGSWAESWYLSAGNELIKRHSIEDPSIEIKKQLLTHLEEGYGLENITISPESFTKKRYGAASSVVPYNSKAADIMNSYRSSDLVLDVVTYNWMGLYEALGTEYKLSFISQMRLLDSSTGQVIVAKRCTPNGVIGSYTEFKTNPTDFNNQQQLMVAECVQEMREALNL